MALADRAGYKRMLNRQRIPAALSLSVGKEISRVRLQVNESQAEESAVVFPCFKRFQSMEAKVRHSKTF